MMQKSILCRRAALVVACAVLGGCVAPVDEGRVGVGIRVGVPGARLGIHVGAYPELVALPGYPVYYAPSLDLNLFFYDGLYWVFADGDWYSSYWYDGPWDYIAPDYVPLFVLRVPLRYYRRLPPAFGGWDRDRPPRWGEHWGREWERRRPGWDRWDRSSAPPRAPLPTYQRDYTGDRYPAREQQPEVRSRNDSYRPRERIPRPPLQQQQPPPRPAPPLQQPPPPRPQEEQRPAPPLQQPPPRPQPDQRPQEEQRSGPPPQQQQQPLRPQREQRPQQEQRPTPPPQQQQQPPRPQQEQRPTPPPRKPPDDGTARDRDKDKDKDQDRDARGNR